MAEKEEQKTYRGKLYMRKWKILIYKRVYKTNEQGQKVRDTENDIAVDVSSLRCVFKTNESFQSPQVSMCTLEVYNLNAAAEGDIIQEGFQISIEAGYQNGQYGLIFEGDIVQVIRNRENGIDYKLEILALKGTSIIGGANFVRCSVAAGSTPREVIKTVATNSDKPIEVGEVSENLSQQKLPRGKVMFSDPNKYFRDVAIGNDAYYWSEDDKLTIKKTIDSIPEGHVVYYTPDTGLVGTPQYGDDGIHITVLLDCRIKLLGLVKINNELIRKQKINLNMAKQADGNTQATGSAYQQNMFDQDGEYQVISLSHSADTHGNTWVSEVVGLSRSARLISSTETMR